MMNDNVEQLLLMIEQGVREHGKHITRLLVKIWAHRCGRHRIAIQRAEKLALELIDAL